MAGLTIFFGLPLYFTRRIHETRFPEGLWFVLMYTWALVAIIALPLLLLVQLYLLLRARKELPAENRKRLLLLGSFAVCFGVVAECVFFVARR